MTEQPYDEISHPPHYTDGKIEHAEYVLDREGWARGYCLGQATKYMHRAGLKPGQDELKDLKKAVWYLQRYILFLEQRTVSSAADEQRVALSLAFALVEQFPEVTVEWTTDWLKQHVFPAARACNRSLPVLP